MSLVGYLFEQEQPTKPNMNTVAPVTMLITFVSLSLSFMDAELNRCRLRCVRLSGKKYRLDIETFMQCLLVVFIYFRWCFFFSLFHPVPAANIQQSILVIEFIEAGRCRRQTSVEKESLTVV